MLMFLAALIDRSHGDLLTRGTTELLKFTDWFVGPLWAIQQFPKAWLET